MTDIDEGNGVVAQRMEVECPLCHRAVPQSIEDHLLDAHSHRELATLVERLVIERLEPT